MAIHHLTTNIAGLMRNCTDKKLGLLFDMDGREVRKELQSLLDKGDRLLPSENCKHFDPQEGCKCRFHESENQLTNPVTGNDFDSEDEPVELFESCNICGLTDDHSIDCPENVSPFALLIKEGYD